MLNHSMNIKNWHNGNMALRWCAAGMIGASMQFGRINGHLHLRAPASTSESTSPRKPAVPSVTMTT
jgi:putative transposase